MQNLCEKTELGGTKWDKPKQANAVSHESFISKQILIKCSTQVLD